MIVEYESEPDGEVGSAGAAGAPGAWSVQASKLLKQLREAFPVAEKIVVTPRTGADGHPQITVSLHFAFAEVWFFHLDRFQRLAAVSMNFARHSVGLEWMLPILQSELTGEALPHESSGADPW